MPKISIICVTYHQSRPLNIFVNCILNQTAPNWELIVIHDGENDEFRSQMKEFQNICPEKIEFFCTPERHNDYGHTLREKGLNFVTGDYVLITNGDNYYVPVLIDLLSREIIRSNPDVVMFDMIHSHNCPGGRTLPSYSYFITEYSRNNIDMGSAIVRSSLAKQARFRDKTFAGDATYFEDIAHVNGGSLTVAKIPRVLFVHN